MKKFKTVKEYYLWASQGNCFAPAFDDLNDSAKKHWVKSFLKYKG